ncbi:MAG: hypothetical protein K0U74_03300 [Alphaproteobacteria bacterium]|nr:hypothetical protein [Alphaproteobacteria bacterium]
MIIRPVEEADVAAVAELEAKVWGASAADADQIRSRSATFKDGNLIAEKPMGVIAGYVVVQRVSQVSTGSWSQQTDNGLLARTHQPDGQLIYGVNLSVTPEGAKHGVSKALIDHCYRKFVTHGPCSAICLGSRLPGFARWSLENGQDVEEYLSRQSGGLSRDPELRIYQKNGFRFLWALKQYFEDQASLNYGAMVIRN